MIEIAGQKLFPFIFWAIVATGLVPAVSGLFTTVKNNPVVVAMFAKEEPRVFATEHFEIHPIPSQNVLTKNE